MNDLLFFFWIPPDGTKTPPSRPGQRANRFAVPPLVHRPLTETASRRAITRQRGNGRSRSTPTGQTPLGCQLQGVFAAVRSPLFTVQGFSMQHRDGYFSSSSLYTWVIISAPPPNVKAGPSNSVFPVQAECCQLPFPECRIGLRLRPASGGGEPSPPDAGTGG